VKYLITSLALAASLAHAQQCYTLVYQGAPLTITGTNPNATPMGNPVVGMIQMNVPLAPNLVNWNPTPPGSEWNSGVPAWDFTAVAPEFNTISTNLFSPIVTFSTDANGNVTDWTFSMLWQAIDLIQNSESITSTPAGDTVTFIGASGTGGPTLTLTGTSSKPGKWMCLDAFIAQAAASQTQDTTLTAQVAALTTQVASLAAQLKNVTAAYTYWVAQVPEVIAAYDYWANRARALTIQINALNAEIAALNAEIAALKK